MNAIRLFYLALLLLSLGCSSPSEKQKIDPKLKDFKLVEVDFLKHQILIPANFQEIQPDEFEEIYMNFDIDSIQAAAIHTIVDNLKRSIFGNQLYIDTNNVNNYLILQLGESVKLDKYVASEYLGMIIHEFERINQEQGIEFDLIERKIMTINGRKLIKLKYKTLNQGVERFQTQYISTKNYKTYSMQVSHTQNMDFEEILKRN